MAFDVLSRIEEVEKKAAQLLQEAHQAAGEVIKNAETQVLEEERKAAVDNRALYHQVMSEHKMAVEASLLAEKVETDKQSAAVLEEAKARLPEAVDHIVREVLRGTR
ncbi:MAG: hypothetical protein GX611_07695 [Clostridiales bacterium]|nr:hypothetical protein [Clostridiales bacterium]